jgi:alkylation response protein AidB-like acyl-CoA dehydrogenase
VSYSGAIEALAAASATLSVIVAVHTSLVAEPIQEFGTPEQKSRWLPALARGEAVGAFALSEAQSGSDAANQRTVARPAGRARLRREGPMPAGRRRPLCSSLRRRSPAKAVSISAFLVPSDAPGLTRVLSPDSLGCGPGCMDPRLSDVLRTAARCSARDAGSRRRSALERAVAIAAQSLGVGQAARDEALIMPASRPSAIRLAFQAIRSAR